MTKSFFLDESGNTGDLTIAGPDFAFEDQPFFVLSCIGFDDEDVLGTEILRLKKKHRIQAPELKFKSVRKKPLFLNDLLQFLFEARSTIMIEATDKRYSLCTHLVECLIVPSVGPMDWGPEARLIKNAFADHLRDHVPNHVLADFCGACHQRNQQSLLNSFQSLITWCKSIEQNDVVIGMLKFLEDAEADFSEIGSEDVDALKRFLPVPDKTKEGNPIHVLPHVHSLLHIYGRLNRHLKAKLADVTLHHDEQAEFGDSLLDAMALAESGVGDDLPNQPAADFKFSEQAALRFMVSDRTIGIQVADLLAGMVAFGLKQVTTRRDELSKEWISAFANLRELDQLGSNLGVNTVTSTRTSWLFHALGNTSNHT